MSHSLNLYLKINTASHLIVSQFQPAEGTSKEPEIQVLIILHFTYHRQTGWAPQSTIDVNTNKRSGLFLFRTNNGWCLNLNINWRRENITYLRDKSTAPCQLPEAFERQVIVVVRLVKWFCDALDGIRTLLREHKFNFISITSDREGSGKLKHT